MPAFPFTITVVNTPPIEVFGVGISYEQILESLGSYFYLIDGIFIESLTSDKSQVNEPLSFERYNSNGMKKTDVVSPNLDPYQKQAAIMVSLKEYSLVADGRLIMTVNILVNGRVRYTFITRRGSLSNGLNQLHLSNQEKIKQQGV